LHLEELEARNLLSVFTPAQIRHAYGFDQISFSSGGKTIPGNGSGETIAIVDAYDDPKFVSSTDPNFINSDLHHFDQQFGLPDPVFTKVTPEGQPAANAGWASEIALDVEWAHAIAPGAKIMLVEAKSDSLTDLLGAVDYARNQPGVAVVSMSWGTTEFAGETSLDSYFTTPAGHQGITFVASSGDIGAWYGPEWPAVSPNVVSVGGTTLSLSKTGNYSGETGWNSIYNPRTGMITYGSTGGYSSYESEPAYQLGVQSSGARTSPDVAYDANPNTGVYMYDSYNGGWFSGGGTSAGAPQWAGLFAIADQGRALAHQGTLFGAGQSLPALYKMAQTSYSTYYHDVTSGSNGYNAGPGYDLVTGLGTPKAQAVVTALVNTSGSGSTISINATVSSTATVTSAKPQIDQQPTANPGDDTSTSANSGKNGSTTTTSSNTVVIELVSVPVFVGGSISPAAVRTVVDVASPGNVPVALLASVPTRTNSTVVSSHVGETSPEQIGGQIGGEKGAVDQNNDEDEAQEEDGAVSSRKGAASCTEVSLASKDHLRVMPWRDLSAACFAEESSRARLMVEEKPVLTMEKTGSIGGPMIALAGMVAILGGYPGTPKQQTEARKKQRLSLAW
jgi:subtilase family serine protease